MNRQHNERVTAVIRFVSGASAAALLLGTAISPRAWADYAQDAHRVVEAAHLSFESFQADPRMGPGLRSLIRKARGVMICPKVLPGGFLLGGASGQGVLLVRNHESNTWSGPAFYALGEASLGLQEGADASEVVLVALTNRGVTALLTATARLGVNASVAVGPVGAGAEAVTENLSADLVSYSRKQGSYVGVSVEGAGVFPWRSLDQAYYGRPVTPIQILLQREVSNPHAAGLIAAIASVAGGSLDIQSVVASAK
jgi:SH3 domain-containing YSC84-like protein 1